MTTSAPTWPSLTTALMRGEDLTLHQARWAMDEVMSGNTTPLQLAGFLVALGSKGETVTEVQGLADVMLDHAVPLDVPRDAIDIVGTGGDQAQTVNISTMASVVIAASGHRVIKHGNRASSSKSGSADVIEALGVRLDLPVEDVARLAHEIGITFCFAQVFHPAMRYAAEARKGLAVPTVFNFLGPITNPGRPRAAAVGSANLRMAPVIAGVFAARGTSALVFRGQDGLDELTVQAPSDVWEVTGGGVTHVELDPFGLLGMDRSPVGALRGGTAQHNARVALDLFAGAKGPVRDAVLLNAAAGIMAARGLGAAPAGPFEDRFVDAFRQAERALDEGRASALLDRWVRATAARSNHAATAQ